ncbi:hypothetical protein L227DRAFT_494356 [Lentinus tigrinus ALCF2SS1-6]|uniref:Gfd2/YDR514C-like C-terminal domain-containing protein n=1 Tax=Lentinus tigrinus ALCF2SS1-6 TaxID=1328759 RepID=A0A5C2SNC5_9APHY|nr:hypothetical protein L227DRAFT_494356 [Lentinus tigrinus ALCF2SS1-6]
MSNFTLVDPKGWDCDLQSVYSAYMGYFQLHNVPWYDRSWGVFFESFEEFLTFSWPTITATDTWTGRAHIVVRMSSIGAFLKMLKTRFGETLPMVENILRITPFETSQRHLRTITDMAQYKKVFATLPAVVLAALKIRVRNGEPKAIRELWASKDKTFLSLDFEWSERNVSSCIEWGYCAVRCGHLDTVGAWPPDPEPNYRRGHYIVTEYADVHNRMKPSYPWAFGESQVISKSKLPQMVQAIVSSLISPDSETIPNTLVLIAHGTTGELRRLEEMKIKLPHNLLIIDTMAFERQLYASGLRGAMQEPSGRPREQGSSLSLPALLQSLGVDVQRILHNAGNAAFMELLGLQLLLDPDTKVPPLKSPNGMAAAMMRSPNRSPATPPSIAFMPSPAVFPQMGMGNMGVMPVGMMPFPVAGGLSPEVFHEPSGSSRTSFFPQQRSISDHRLQVSPNVAMATGGRLPGRARVNSMNSMKNSVNELGEQLGNLQLKSRSANSRTPPNL